VWKAKAEEYLMGVGVQICFRIGTDTYIICAGNLENLRWLHLFAPPADLGSPGKLSKAPFK